MLIAWLAILFILMGWFWCCCNISCVCTPVTTMPQVIHATFSNSGTGCLFDGQVYALTWSAANSAWQLITSPPNQIIISINCPSGACTGSAFNGTGATLLTCTAGGVYKATKVCGTFPGAAFANAGCTCSPLNMVFNICVWSNNGFSGCGCALAGTNYTVTVTP